MKCRPAPTRCWRQGCEGVCVFFVNGYANDENERIAVEAVRAVWPTSFVTAATEILPEIREFERCSTATLNAYLQPVVASYLDRLEQAVAARDFGGQIAIVQSNGGVMSVDLAKRFPVRTALSGPAAGVIAARAIARAAGFDNIITCDMGGTSFDVSLVANGESALAAQTAIDFGMVVRTPMIEITTIGAGGGSIARVNEGGILAVGPESAGSDPGPVCYGLGNDRPTVTDANLVLGRINPDRPIGGKLDRLDIEASREAIRREVSEPLNLDVMDAAEAILRVANAMMAGAIRLVSIERGHDPGEFAAMPFGGGGALHTGALISEVGLNATLVPRYPGVTSALGCVVADMRHDRVQTVNRMLDDLDANALGREMTAVGDELESLIAGAGMAFERTDRAYEFDMLYLGQTPHGLGADRHAGEWPYRRGDQGGLRGRLPRGLRQVARRHSDPGHELPGCRNRPASTLRHGRLRAAGRRRFRHRQPAGLPRRRLARGFGSRAPSHSRRRRHRGAGALGAGRHHHLHRSGPFGPHGRLRQPDHRARLMNIATTALLIVDLQNDFLHPDGAYGRAGQKSDAIAALPARVKPVADAVRTGGGWIVSTQFTLVPGKGGEPFISAHLKKLRPFLEKGDFTPGAWGHQLVDELQPADLAVEKIAYSAFHMTRLEWVLRKAGIETLIACGIVTNGGVASTVRAAHVREFHTIVLSDGCAAFREETHAASIRDLSSISDVMTCAEALAALSP